jgi:hypothetical protein
MKYIRLILAVILGAVLSQSANATTVLTEQFINYATGELGSAGTGSTGGVPGWNTPRSHIVVTNGSGSLDGTGLGLVESAGDMAIILNTANTNDDYDTSGGVPNGAYNLFANKNTPYPTFPATTNVNLYTSFLYQFNDNTGFYSNGVSMIAGMYYENGGIQSSGGTKAYWQLLARTNASGQIQLGITKNMFQPPYGLTNWASTLVSVGQTFFAVVRLQIAATNGVSYNTNDEVDLWIDPPPDSFGTNEADVPTPDAVSPPGDGTPISGSTGPGRFFITDNGPSAYLDELRIATNWAEVTPPLGQCLPASFTTNPTNMTQSAEINATLVAAAANSTSPTFQWQISQDHGSTWSNIGGAVRSVYTTPNLQYATDNGNQYRAIAHVACDNTYATSSVATVTLTQPTPTPSPSTVMDDTFPGSSFRDVGPVTASHSVWFTSDQFTSDLYTDPNGTGLIAVPQSGSSTLYLGYYVNETASSMVPVHLAIGTQMTATLIFIPDSFGSFTNNGALRFGLFDYADSGTLVTEDGPNLSGSTGEGLNVRGYMLNLDFGTNFSSDTPLTLYVRNGLQDNNLMGTTGDYLSMGSGPVEGSYSNTLAFQAGTTYTLAFTVARTDTNTCIVTTTITGGSLNLSYTATDTNDFGYHRFDTIAVRPNKLENAADQFTFPELEVQVTNAPVQVSNIAITGVSHTGNNVALTWQATPGNADISSGFTVYRKSSLTDATWTTLQSGISTTNYTDTTATNASDFYRVSQP